MFIVDRGGRQPAVADDMGCHALADGTLSRPVDQNREIGMGVDIDETRGDGLTLDIDHPLALQRPDLPDVGDLAVLDGQITPKPGIAAAMITISSQGFYKKRKPWTRISPLRLKEGRDGVVLLVKTLTRTYIVSVNAK